MFWSLIVKAIWWGVPMVDRKILILGGTALAKKCVAELSRLDLQIVYSLAGRTKPRSLPDAEIRVGGFGGIDALRDYLAAEKIAAVIDATHAYAAQISTNAHKACHEAKVPLLRLEEPAWQAIENDNWTIVSDVAAAIEAVAKVADKVLVTTGRQTIENYAQDSRCHWFVRIVPTDDELPVLQRGEYIHDHGPFDVSDERKLIQDQSIDTIISKNAGSAATYAKIAAAQALDIPVIMIDRPLPPDVETVSTPAQVTDWLNDILDQ
jgi:precorrin-6A/cobalt-precorrin-6A reductase